MLKEGDKYNIGGMKQEGRRRGSMLNYGGDQRLGQRKDLEK